MSPPKKRERRFRRRILKIGLWSIVIPFLFACTAFIYIRVRYPEQKVLDLLSEKVQSGTGMPLVIQNITWKFPLKLQIDQIKIGYPDSNIENDRPFVTLDRFSVSFRLLALLKRQLHVQSVTISRPNINIQPEKLKTIRWAQSDSQEQTADTSRSAGRDENRLPISIRLSRFRLDNFSAYLILSDSTGNYQVEINDLNIDLDRMQIPREVSTSIKGVRGMLHLYTRESRISYRSNNLQLSLIPEIDVNVRVRKHQYWEIKGLCAAESPGNRQNRIAAEVNIKGYGMGDTVRVDPVVVTIGSDPVLTVTGSATHLTEKPNLRFNLQAQRLDLLKAHNILTGFKTQELAPAFETISPSGAWMPVTGEIWGTPNDIRFQLRSDLKASVRLPAAELDSLYYVLEANGHLKNGTLNSESGTPLKKRVWYSSGVISGQAGFGSGRFSISDSIQAETGPLAIRFSSTIDTSGFPDKGNLEGGWSDLFGGRMGLNINWGMSQHLPPSIESLFVNGTMEIKDLEIADLPGMSNQIRGKAGLQTGFNLSDMKRAQLKLNANFPDLFYQAELTEGRFPPLSLQSSWIIQTDSAFKKVRIDSGIVNLNNLLSGWLTGSMNLNTKRMAVKLRTRINHDRIYDNLPNFLLPLMEGISAKGNTTLTADFNGNYTKPESITMKDTLQIQNGEFHHTMQNLHVEGLNGELSAGGTLDNLLGNGRFSIRRVSSAIRKQPIENSEINFNWAYDQKNIKLNSLVFRNNSLNTEMQLSGIIENIDTSPALQAGGELIYNGNVWTEMVQEIGVQGTGRILFHIDQRDSGNSVVSGTAFMKELNIHRADILALTGINGQVPFQIGINPEGIILSDSGYHPPTWIEYENRQSQFRSLKGEQGSLNIKAVELNGYPLTDIAMNVDIRNGYVQIPWFVIHAFNGNLGGYLQVFLGTGSPETVTYEIHAQAARINAAALGNVTIKNEEEGELNAAMAFTGTGLDPNKEIEVDGYFYITKIGPEFASLMLEGLDPEGNDRNIRLTRWLLDRGWKPKLFSFEMRHGYVYPSLSLAQPWFSPIRLPETLSFGRLPLQFFLDNPELAKAK